MHNHIKVLAILFIAVGVIGAFMGLAFMALMLIGPAGWQVQTCLDLT